MHADAVYAIVGSVRSSSPNKSAISLVALIESRSSLRGDSAREALTIIRGGPPEGVVYEREPLSDAE